MANNIIKKKPTKFKRLDFTDRCLIETRYCRDRKSLSDIALEMKRPLCTICREIDGRPRLGRGKYSASIAQAKALDNYEKQGRKSKLENNKELFDYVLRKLKINWSPEQIAGRLIRDHPNSQRMRISYEAIYTYIYQQIRLNGDCKAKTDCVDWRPYLARRHTRRSKKGFRQAQKLERSIGLPSIEERPKEVEKRKEVGHWEGDTLVSRASEPRIKSVNERVSGVVFFGKTKDGTANECDKILINKLSIIPAEFLKTLTQDRGKENYGYKLVESALKISCYFAHAYCSQERGSNENTNGLFRRYFPKKTDFSKVTDEEILQIECLINNRPRKRFGFLTPLEVLYIKTGVAIEY